MPQINHYTYTLFSLSLLGVSSFIIGNESPRFGIPYRNNYRIVSGKIPFEKIIKSKKYALVLFYKYSKNGANQSLIKEELQTFLKVVKTFRDVSNHEKHQKRDDLLFLEVNVALRDGEELFNQYNIESLPGYVLLEDGKELKEWGQVYSLSGNMNAQELEQFLDKVLKQ